MGRCAVVRVTALYAPQQPQQYGNSGPGSDSNSLPCAQMFRRPRVTYIYIYICTWPEATADRPHVMLKRRARSPPSRTCPLHIISDRKI